MFNNVLFSSVLLHVLLLSVLQLLPCTLCFSVLPATTTTTSYPSIRSSSRHVLSHQPQSVLKFSTELKAVKSGGTRKSDSESPQPQQHDQPRWKDKVEAKRPFLGHVVPQTSTTRRQQRRKVRPQGTALAPGAGSSSRPQTPPLRILGGSFRGRKLRSPQVHLRPMMGKVREACFSTLTYFGLYKPPPTAAQNNHSARCRHLDIFAGSGSVGLESLSRGATHCTFVDLAPQCCDTIRANLELCRISSSSSSSSSSSDPTTTQTTASVVCADALEFLRDPATALLQQQPAMGNHNDPSSSSAAILEPYQIITICPPYEEVVYGDLIDAVCNSPLLVTDDTIVLIEYPIELGCLPHVYDLQGEGGGKMIGLRNRRYGRTVVAMYIINPTGKLEGADSRPEEFVTL